MRHRILLAENLEVWTRSSAQEFIIGTGCSGSDIIVTVLQKMAFYWKETHGVSLCIRHRMSVEVNQSCQAWILKHHSPDYLFGDMCQLSAASAFDFKSESMVPVPKVHFFAFGSECDNLSSLNQHTKTAGCIQQGTHKSGRTAHYAFEYVRKHRPHWALMENVMNLDAGSQFKQTDKDFVVSTLESLEYTVHAGVHTAAQSGSPQSRSRFYIVAFHTPSMASPRQDSFDADHFPVVVGSLKNVPITPLCEFVLPSEHPEVKAKAMTPGPATQQKGQNKFEADHMDMYKRVDLDWPPTDEDHMCNMPFACVHAHLCMRCVCTRSCV